jgi:hypothetical protein
MFTTRSASPANPGLGWRVGSLLGLALLWLAVGTACEDKAVGRPCSLGVDASASHAAYTTEATDCPSHLCVKPAVQPGVSTDLDTGPYCTIRCSSDTDCDGQERDPSNPLDFRCRKGFTCAPVFNKGSLCCQKICLCRDFFSSSVGPAIPPECLPDSGVSCS